MPMRAPAYTDQQKERLSLQRKGRPGNSRMPRIASIFSALFAVVAAGAVALLLLSLSVPPSPGHVDTSRLSAAEAHIHDSVVFLRNKGVLQGSDFGNQKFAFLLNPLTSKNRTHYEGCQHPIAHRFSSTPRAPHTRRALWLLP